MPLTFDQFFVLETAGKDRDLTKFHDQVLPTLNRALDGGDIWNVEFQGCKEVIVSLIESAAQGFLKEAYLAQDQPTRDADTTGSEVYWLYWNQVNAVAANKKKLQRMDQNHRMVKAGLKLIGQVEPLIAALETLKPQVKKGRQPNPDAPAPYVPPPAALPVIERMVTTLKQLTDHHRQDLVTRFTRNYVAMAEDYGQRFEQVVSTGVRVRRLADVYGRRANVFIPQAISAFIGDEYKLLPNYRAIAGKRAERDADETLALFIGRNTAKLSPIIGGKAKAGIALSVCRAIESELRADGLWARLQVAFDDGASFTTKSQIVWSTSGIGRWGGGGTEYARYPTTFHDVVLANGEKLSQPSEEKMNEIFAAAGAVAGAPEAQEDQPPAP